jgi:hypothetical protein
MMTTIFVNGDKALNVSDVLTYEEIVTLATKGEQTPGQLTVQYTRGGGDKSSGTLLPGQSVAVRDGMVFDAVFTGYA